MYSSDYDSFRRVIEELSLAFNRPFTDELVRVFWDALKDAPFPGVKELANKWKVSGKKFPTPSDLRPERVRAPARKELTEEDREVLAMSSWAIAANRILFSVAYQGNRGFRPIAKYPPPPESGLGLPLKLVKPEDDTLLRACLAAKADYVRMAEEAEAGGEPWDRIEFNRMCREGFEKLLAA